VFKRAITWATALGLGLVAGLALSAAPAQAEELIRQSPVRIDQSYGACAPVKLTTYAEAYIVASANGQTVVSESAGAAVKIGPFDAPTVVYWRLFGGPERDNDYPLWIGHPDTYGGLSNTDFKDAINAYGTAFGGFEWTTYGPVELDGNPFIRDGQWKKFRVKGCATPEEPTSSQLECAAGDAPTIAGAIEIPDTEGVQYLLDGEEIEAGTHELVPGAYTVTAEPKPGYVLDEDVDHAWDFTVAPINGCPGTPGTPGPPGDPGAPGADGQDGTDGEGGMNQASNDKQLPQTGSPALLLFGIGLFLTVIGGLGMALPRLWRRNPQVQ
jgi:hypothetical protein